MINYQVTCIIFLLPVVNGVTLLLVSTGRKRDALLEKRELTPIPPPKLSSHLFSPNYDMGGGGVSQVVLMVKNPLPMQEI